MGRLLCGVLLIGLGAGLSTPAGAQLAPETAARVDSVFADLNRTDGPGCALGVVRDGRLAYAKGYGSSNLDYRRPITPETVFRLASVSKHVTAAAVVLAERQRHLSLDDPVRKWLPNLPEYEGQPITLRHLIHHTSGLRDFIDLADLTGWRFPYAHPQEDYLDLLYRQQGLNFKPGTDHDYSNTNYLLLAEVVKTATGSSLQKFAEENIFRPLGMRHTHFHDEPSHIIRNRAIGYARTEHGFRMNHPWKYQVVGEDGLHSSIEDLARWDRNFDTQTVGGEGFAEQMTTPGRLASGDTIDYAFGLRLHTYRGQDVVEHGGSNDGFRSHYLRFPDANRSVIVLCNLTSASPHARAQTVADIVLADQLASKETPGNGSEQAPGPSLSANELEVYMGAYRSSGTGYVRFLVDEGHLAFEALGERYALRPVASDQFAMTPEIKWTFDGTEDGHPDRAVYTRGDTDTIRFRRVDDVATYTETDLAAFEGRYHSEELGVHYRVRTTNTTPRLVQGTRAPRPLRPGIRDEFRFDGKYIRFVRDDAGNVTGFTVHSPSVTGIRFERRP